MKKNLWVAVSLMVLVSMLFAACSAAPASEGSKKIRVATDAAYPPFESVDETSKELVGFDIELFKAVAEKADLEFEFVNVGFDPLLAGMSECQYDAAISAITITEERAKSMSFSDPYINAGQIVTVQVSNTDIKSSADLTGKTIGVQLGTTGQIEAEKIEGASVKTYDTVDLAFLDLANGQVDAVVADYPTSNAYIATNAGKLMTVGEPFTEETYGIAVCKKNEELLKTINDALAKVKADGLIDELDAKWVKGQE